jgi:hypothetical protein
MEIIESRLDRSGMDLSQKIEPSDDAQSRVGHPARDPLLGLDLLEDALKNPSAAASRRFGHAYHRAADLLRVAGQHGFSLVTG